MTREVPPRRTAPRRWAPALACGVAAVLVLSAAATAGALPSAGAAPGALSRPVPVVAPYFEPTNVHTHSLLKAIRHHGLSAFTAAFVLGRGCTPTWDDDSPITGTDANSRLVEQAIRAGGRPILSFGGQAGDELATTCIRRGKLVAAYQRVMTLFGTRRLDFDIEGARRLDDTATNARRFRALRALEQRYPDLEVSLTVPVDRDGLNGTRRYGDVVALLRQAQRLGTRVDVVNLMTMDYGGPVANMGAAATAAATDALAQIKRIWPHDGWANIGITPMIGHNDVAHEVFTPSDARVVRRFASQHGVGRLAFWAVNRDNPCGPSGRLDTCSGVAQRPFEFTDLVVG